MSNHVFLFLFQIKIVFKTMLKQRYFIRILVTKTTKITTNLLHITRALFMTKNE